MKKAMGSIFLLAWIVIMIRYAYTGCVRIAYSAMPGVELCGRDAWVGMGIATVALIFPAIILLRKNPDS